MHINELLCNNVHSMILTLRTDYLLHEVKLGISRFPPEGFDNIDIIIFVCITQHMYIFSILLCESTFC